MFGTFGRLVIVVALVVLCSAPASAQPVTFTGNYTQNFDGMGGAGTTPPTGWQYWNVNPAGASNTTWDNTSGVGGNGVPVSGVTATPGLTAMDTPTATNNNGYNSIGASGQASDRAI